MYIPSRQSISDLLAYKSLKHFAPRFFKYKDTKDFVGGWHVDYICDHLQAVTEGKIKKLLINMPPRHKILTTTPLATIDGWKTIGTVQVGDYVFSPNGKPVLVTGKSDIYYKQIYEVETSDGQILETDADHLWSVRYSSAVNGTYKTMSTVDILNKQENTISKNWIPKLPYHNPVQYPERNLKIHPYILGAWLGDGASSCGTMAANPDDAKHIRAMFEQFGIPTTTTKWNMTFGTRGLRVKLREIGVLNNKHIPEEYLSASIEQRMWLLRGLIDTDGDVTKEGKVTFNGSNYTLVKQVCQLVHSFGLKARITTRNTGSFDKYKSRDSYRVMFKMLGAASLPRKAKRCKTLNGNRARSIKVRKTNRYNTVQCIEVANKDGLFLAGKGFIVTHNCKSSLVSVLWPAWAWLHDPQIQWLFISYASPLSIRDNVSTRRVVNSDEYMALIRQWHPTFDLTRDENTKIKFTNTSGGYRMAGSVDGSTTGEGGDYVVFDDPNNVREGESEVKLATTNSYYSEAALSRRNPRADKTKLGGYVVIQQRMNENDVSGYLLDTDKKFEHLCMPARYEGENRIRTSLNYTDPRTEIDEPLWPVMFGPDELDELGSGMGPYAKAGQLQQRPAPRGGGMFKTANIAILKTFDRSKIKRSIRGWDNAGSAGKGCYTAGVLIHLMQDGTYIIEDCVRGQWSALEREKIKKATAELDGMKVTIWVEKEPGSSGKDVAEATVRDLAPYICYVENPTGDKVHRAETLSAQTEAGNVSVIKGEWTRDFLQELSMFPAGKYKDQVDAATLAFNKIFENVKRVGVWGSEYSR